MSTEGVPDFNQWLTRVHGFKVGAYRNSYTVADVEAAWNAAERAWMEIANNNAQERNAAVDREVVLIAALKDLLAVVYNLQIAVPAGGAIYRAEAAIKQAERT